MSKFIWFLGLIVASSCGSKRGVLDDISLLPVKSGNDWGYINFDGKYEINPQFSSAHYFSEGLARIGNKDGQYGYVDKTGSIVISTQFKEASVFSEGLACVVKENSFPSFIDKNGNIVIELKNAEKVGDFHDGLAPVMIDDQWGYINKEGEFVINPQFDGALAFFDGLARVFTIDDEKRKKYGFINTKGEFVINPQFEFVTYFREGFAAFNNGEQVGFINRDGEYVINPQFDLALPFKDGKALILKGGSFGIINTEGEFIINPQFDEVGITALGGLIPVKQSNKWGFIDENGKYQINPQFDDVKVCFCKIAAVESAGKIGFVNREGKYVINPQFDAIAEINEHGQVYGLTNEMITLETDYFDAGGFVNLVVKGNEFLKLTPNATYQDVALVYPDSISRIYNSKVRISGDDDLYQYFKHDQVKIDEIEVSFKGQVYETRSLYETKTSDWGKTYRKYVGSEKVYNDTVQITKIEFSFITKNRGLGKAGFLAENLGEALSKVHSAQGYAMNKENENEHLYFSLDRSVFIYLIKKHSNTINGFVSFDKATNQDVYEKLEEKQLRCPSNCGFSCLFWSPVIRLLFLANAQNWLVTMLSYIE